MSLGENIYNCRVLKNWSQTELADALAVSRQSVSKWENGSATPDLDKLIKMKELFGVSLDDLVFGKPDKAPESVAPAPVQTPPHVQHHMPNFRIYMGMVMLMFGMLMLLLSIFWGDHLYFGEAFGELLSAVIVLVSIAMIVPYDFRVFTVCTVIYFIYTVICFGIMKISSITNSIFTLIASIVIVVWFIVCGLHATRNEVPWGDTEV